MKARIKNSPFVYDVNPWFENGLFCGYYAMEGMVALHFKPDDMEFQEELDPVSPLEPGPDVKEMNIFDAIAYKQPHPHEFPSRRLVSRIRAMFPQKFRDEITIGDIISIPRSEWMKLHGFGRKTLNQLDEMLERLGVWNDWIKR